MDRNGSGLSRQSALTVIVPDALVLIISTPSSLPRLQQAVTNNAPVTRYHTEGQRSVTFYCCFTCHDSDNLLNARLISPAMNLPSTRLCWGFVAFLKEIKLNSLRLLSWFYQGAWINRIWHCFWRVGLTVSAQKITQNVSDNLEACRWKAEKRWSRSIDLMKKTLLVQWRFKCVLLESVMLL